MASLDWLLDKLGQKSEILVFAHSMGAAIASHALSVLAARNQPFPVKRLILMSPFNNFYDQISSMTSNSWFMGTLVSLFGRSMLGMLNMEFRYKFEENTGCPKKCPQDLS